MKMEEVNEEKRTYIVGDINRRRGQVNDMGDRAETIKADVPLSEMFGYVTTLRTFHLVEQHLLWIFTYGNSF
jgi:elongation factor G